LEKFADQELTLADAHGLVVMKSRRIVRCWANRRNPGLLVWCPDWHGTRGFLAALVLSTAERG
jgi:hypothetical protein